MPEHVFNGHNNYLYIKLNLDITFSIIYIKFIKRRPNFKFIYSYIHMGKIWLHFQLTKILSLFYNNKESLT